MDRAEDDLLILDCESYESALRSVSEVYDTSAQLLDSVLHKIDLKQYESSSGYHGPDDYMKRAVEAELRTCPRQLDAVCWFHLTRVPPGTDFSEGILPLQLALGKIWETLLSILRDPGQRSNLRRLKGTGVPDYLYELKTKDVFHSGPYAMLVRESAFYADALGNWDYLRMPEIIDDICNGYKTEFGESIYEEVSKGLRGCVVKFESVKDKGPYLLGPALLYCWGKANSAQFNHAANSDYDAGGKIIPRNAIRSVEFV